MSNGNKFILLTDRVNALGGGAAVLVLIVLAFACQHKQPLVSVVPEEKIVVTGHGFDRPDAICQDFRLNSAQAKQFFAKSRPITAKELHDSYEYMPCWVEGTMADAQGTSKWKIRPIGIGEIQRPNGALDLVGCKTCDDLFK